MCNRRWDSLVDLAVMLREEELDLDALVRQIEKKKTGHDQEIGGSVSWIKKRSRNERVNWQQLQESDLVRQIQKEKTGHDQEIGGSTVSTTKKRSRNDNELITISEKRRKIRIQGSFVCNSSKTMKKKQGTTEPIVLSEEIKKVIVDCGGTEESAVLVIDKTLSRSDVNPGQCRLSIPYGKISKQFLVKLYPSEAARLDSVSDGGIRVNLFVGGGGGEHIVRLKNWKSNNMYVLVEGWKDVYCRNSLKEGQSLKLWSFRRNLDLCLALEST